MRSIKVFFVLFVIICLPLMGNETTFLHVWQQHLKTLLHLEETNPPLLIMLSGTPGMGKTYTAKNIEKSLKAIRLSSDVVRDILKENQLSVSLVDDYLDYCLLELQKKSMNRTIIFDRSCDRTFDRYVTFSKNHGYRTYLIRMVVPRSIAEERIISRGYNVESFFKRFDDFWKDYCDFSASHRFDFYLENSLNNNYYDLISSLKKTNSFRHSSSSQEVNEVVKKNIVEFVKYGKPCEATNFTHPIEIIPQLYIGNHDVADIFITKEPSYISSILSLGFYLAEADSRKILRKNIVVNSKISLYFDEAYSFIEQTEDGILIHCHKGCSKSPAVVIAYLMKKFQLPFSLAYAYVKKKHPKTDINEEFVKQLQAYENELNITFSHL